jgi:hypothetical protein
MPSSHSEPQPLASEPLISLRRAAALLLPPRHSKPVKPSFIVRWIRRGVMLPSGERVRLEAVRLDGRWLTSADAVYRFVAQVSGEFRP